MTKAFPTRWYPMGFHGPPKNTFPAEFCDEYHTIYLYTKNNYIQATNPPPKKSRFKMATKWPIFVFSEKNKTKQNKAILFYFFKYFILFYSILFFFFCVKRSVSTRMTITNNTCQKFDTIKSIKYAKNFGRAPWTPLVTEVLTAHSWQNEKVDSLHVSAMKFIDLLESLKTFKIFMKFGAISWKFDILSIIAQ